MRIITGIVRGRQIILPPGMHTRPTLERVKEGMFGMIQFDIANRHVLDLFAGSGNLGLEALSRGALSAIFCDNDRQAVEVIKKNVDALGFSSHSSVHFSDAESLLLMLASSGIKLSLVFLDPPYALGLVEKAVDMLLKLELMLPGCIIVAEHAYAHKLRLADPGLSISKSRKYGDVAVSIIKYQSEEL